MSAHHFLPGVLKEIADVAGIDAALRIAEARGGSSLSIPPSARDDSPLVAIVGRAAAEKLCDHFTSGYTSAKIEIPLGPAGSRATVRRALTRLLAEGVPGEEIARRLKIAARTVRRHKSSRAPRCGRQGRLF